MDKPAVNPVSYEDEIDYAFIKQVIEEVTQSCALPNPIPLERIPNIILQVARWFWQNDDQAVERRVYLIKNSEFCNGNGFNKLVKLPEQIMAVCGAYKSSGGRYGNMGDFSLERMMMQSFNTFGAFGGSGTMGSGYNLTDVVAAMYEIDTFDQTLNPTVSYDYNMFSKKLVVLGDLGHSDLIIECWKRLNLHALYQNYYFFRMCVCYIKRSLAQIYGSFTFKYPGGVEINYDSFASDAKDEIDEIKEAIENNHAVDYFYQPNVF